jgi:diguanylate cyclase (GGDEF)-like protein
MDFGQFLCRDDTERRRMVDLTRNLRPGMPVVLGLFVVAGLSGIPTYGLLPLLPPFVALAVYGLFWRLDIGRRRRPEFLWAGVIFLAEAMMALSQVLARGPRGYSLVIMSMPVLLAALIFPRRAAIAATVGGVLLLALVLAVADSNEVRHIPAVGLVCLFVLVSLAVTAFVIRDLDDASRRSAFVDELTGTLNRSALTPKIAELTHRGRGTGEPLSLIVGDIDHFKDVNDTHGHSCGDRVLREIAGRLGGCVTASEPLYRLGGEEFLILLPGVRSPAAAKLAQRMRGVVADRRVDNLSVTMSFGVATTTLREQFDFDEAFARADYALYAAKRGGRNRVETDGGEADTAAPPPGGGVRRTDMARVAPVAPVAAVAASRSRRSLRAVPSPNAVPAAGGWTRRGSAEAQQAGSVTAELEREFVLDLNGRLSTLFRIIAAGAFLVIASGIPSFGWHPLIAPVVGAVPYYSLSRLAHRFRHPSRALVTGWVLFQTSIAIGFACSHGAPLFALPFFALMVPGRCAVFRSVRAAAVGTAYTGLLMTAVALWLNADRVAHNPAILLFPLALLCEAGYIGATVGRSTVSFRGAGIVDGLTGLLNRTALGTRLIELETQSAGVDRQVAVILADIDHFKQINDTHGHAVGDDVLRAVAARIQGSLRSLDSVYRVGGEEFMVLLPGAELGAAARVAERIHQAVRQAPCGGREVTVSVGVAATAAGERFVYSELFERADRALYMAKDEGRDRVCAQDSEPNALPVDVAGAAA